MILYYRSFKVRVLVQVSKNFHFSTPFRLALETTQLMIQWVQGALSLGVQQLGCEIDHSPPASAEVQKTWVQTSTPTYVFMV
jgi:hypothetical protein